MIRVLLVGVCLVWLLLLKVYFFLYFYLIIGRVYYFGIVVFYFDICLLEALTITGKVVIMMVSSLKE